MRYVFLPLHTLPLQYDHPDLTAQTAERVGRCVRSLDEEMRRAGEVAGRVGQVMELKSSLARLQSYIENKDWESAARCWGAPCPCPLQSFQGPCCRVFIVSDHSKHSRFFSSL
ncbi:uncharacterized protein HD556DRAFT_1243230 [Suillus plorans]|uniref:Conserved oligomeric Golgi complex subunit 4 N-terminal domain-containing protein n=1 Tax=Suillus plorans TaxID=116603 RepID=A0A9P7AJJ4_9AGAM|nr:uncharacterized protein HD556DRAFT_1243230 [Suillus plorans]KAG1789844.1 hypothetical protein HD556DRAFT_1243230 [Suillus plorans]